MDEASDVDVSKIMWKIETSNNFERGPQNALLDYVLFRLWASLNDNNRVSKMAALGGKLSVRVLSLEDDLCVHTAEFENHADYVQFLLEHGG